MKNLLFLLAILVGINSMVFSQETQKPLQSPRVTAEGKNVKISYGQPSKRGRVIFGQKEPYGKVWRTGANEATEVTFAKDGTFGGKPVKAGTYTLFTIPGEKEWSVILNSELKQWGAYKYDQSKDVLQVTVPATTISGPPVEKLTITFPENKFVLEWDQTRVEVPMKF